MSIHGICFDNGMNGECNIQCEKFQAGNCPEPIEVIKMCQDENYEEDIQEAYTLYGIDTFDKLIDRMDGVS